MITILAGENSFEIEREIGRLSNHFDGEVVRVDGEGLELKQVPDLIMGMSLFAVKRLVIIKNASLNKTVWTALEDWLPRVSGDIDLIFVESKPDKRTKTYKELVKIATIIQCDNWNERGTLLAEQWIAKEATTIGLVLDKKSIQLLVTRVGANQWLLFQALQKLRVVDHITPDVIENIIDSNPIENVFNLFETALRGDSNKLKEMLKTLEMTEDPFRLFGLLNGQVLQLAALSVASISHAEVAKDFGVHPYAMSKMMPYATKLGRHGAKELVGIFATSDAMIKTSSADPWLLIGRALMKIAYR